MTEKSSREFSDCRETRQVHQSALADPRFRRYYPASWFSSLGAWLLRFLLGWSAWELTHSATWVGIVGALMLAPALVLSPWFGILSDRVNPRHGLQGSLSVHALIALVGLGTTHLGWYDRSILACLATALGVVTSLHSPMRLALIPLLVPKAALPSAVGYSAMSFNTARILGPALGAALVAQVSVSAAWALAVCMFAGAFWGLSRLRDIGQASPPSGESFPQQLLAGLRYLALHADLKLLLALTALNGLLGRTVVELLPAVSGKLLGGGSTELAVLVAMAGAGSVVGGLLVSRQTARLGRLLLLVVISIFIGCLSLLSLRWFSGLWAVGVWVSVLSVVTTVAGTGCQTMIQLSVEGAFRGRIMSLWTVLAMGAPALGAAILGWGVDAFGFFPVLTTTASVGGALLALLYTRREVLLDPPESTETSDSR